MLVHVIESIHSKYSGPMESASDKLFQTVLPFAMDVAEGSINEDMVWNPRITPLANNETNPAMVSFDMDDTSVKS